MKKAQGVLERYRGQLVELASSNLFLVSQETTAQDAVMSTFFFLDGMYSLIHPDVVSYLHERYGVNKHAVLTGLVQEALASIGVAEEMPAHHITEPLAALSTMSILEALAHEHTPSIEVYTTPDNP